MPGPIVTRPKLAANSDTRREIERYLLEHYRRANDARSAQVDKHFANWAKNYDAVPAQQMRTIPFYNASNFVVPVTRMFIDTFVARTLHVIFATKPLILADGFPNDLRQAGEDYLNRKARYEWGYYKLFKGALGRGNKNGTCILKNLWADETEEMVIGWDGGEPQSELIEVYSGPKTRIVPFEDFWLYPITANELEDAEITFHRQRFTEEYARRRRSDPDKPWELTKGDLESALLMPADVKREAEQAEAGVSDYQYREFQTIECSTKWRFEGKDCKIIGVICPQVDKMIDLYFDPTPPGCPLYSDYRPFPKDDFFWGDGLPKLLAQGQEEISRIHNERRDNNSIANATIFKKKTGARVPISSTTIMPGRVYEVDEMDDFDAVNFGRALMDTIPEEMNAIALLERLVGIDGIMQGSSQGGQGKNNVYNTGGTIAVMSERNTRQNTNIRDFRETASSVAKANFILQKTFNPSDPTIEMFDPDKQQKIRQFFAAATRDRLNRSFFEVRASDPGSNREVDRQNHLQMSQILSQYGTQVLGMAQQLQTVKNPLMQKVIMASAAMLHEMGLALASDFEMLHLEGKLPDLAKYYEEQQQQQQREQQQQGANGGGMGIPGTPAFQQGMAQLGQVSQGNGPLQ